METDSPTPVADGGGGGEGIGGWEYRGLGVAVAGPRDDYLSQVYVLKQLLFVLLTKQVASVCVCV